MEGLGSAASGMNGFEHRPGKADLGGGLGVGVDSARVLCEMSYFTVRTLTLGVVAALVEALVEAESQREDLGKPASSRTSNTNSWAGLDELEGRIGSGWK